MFKNIVVTSVMLMLLMITQASVSAQSDYQTFDFMEFDVQVLVDVERRPENVDYLKAAIQRELEAKGLTLSDNPDLLVNIGVVVKEEVQTRETSVREMQYLGQRNYAWQVQEVPIGTYNEGTVNIDLVDAAKNERVWEGSASAVILKSNTKMQKRIDQGMKKAFKKFDPVKL